MIMTSETVKGASSILSPKSRCKPDFKVERVSYIYSLCLFIDLSPHQSIEILLSINHLFQPLDHRPMTDPQSIEFATCNMLSARLVVEFPTHNGPTFHLLHVE